MKHLLSLLLVPATLILTGCPAQNNSTNTTGSGTAAKPVSITMASAYPLNLPIMGTSVAHVRDQCAIASDGSITINLKEPNALVALRKLASLWCLVATPQASRATCEF